VICRIIHSYNFNDKMTAIVVDQLLDPVRPFFVQLRVKVSYIPQSKLSVSN